MADVEIKLLANVHPVLEKALGPEVVRESLYRIGDGLGYNFQSLLREKDDDLYIVSPVGGLNPENWHYLPTQGTAKGLADGPHGLALFFLLASGLPYAEHQWKWANHVYECWADDIIAVIEASRGFGKSIFMRGAMAYQIGLHPKTDNLIIRASDRMAIGAAERIAGIITDNNAWKMMFPHITPKRMPGQSGGAWSAHQGYSVRDNNESDADWAEIEAGRTSPTLFKFGYGSKLLGGRVTGCMLVDDIHDRQNAEAPMQLEALTNLFVGDIRPMMWPMSRGVIIGTPWGVADILQTLPETPGYSKIKTPITEEGTYPGTPTWPDVFDEEQITKLYEEDVSIGRIEFKKNRLLDLTANIDQMMKFTEFPENKIKDTWLIRMGIDFAYKDAMDPGQGRSYFALEVQAQDPESAAWIIIDGYVAQVPQETSERIVADMFRKYGKRTRVEGIFIEAVQTGDMFLKQLARLDPEYPLYPIHPGGEAKRARWEADLQPALANERILISNDPNIPFLQEVRNGLRSYPHIKERGDKYADILDAIYYANYYTFFAYNDPVRRRKSRGSKEPNPYFAFGNPPEGGWRNDPEDNEDNNLE